MLTFPLLMALIAFGNNSPVISPGCRFAFKKEKWWENVLAMVCHVCGLNALYSVFVRSQCVLLPDHGPLTVLILISWFPPFFQFEMFSFFFCGWHGSSGKNIRAWGFCQYRHDKAAAKDKHKTLCVSLCSTRKAPRSSMHKCTGVKTAQSCTAFTIGLLLLHLSLSLDLLFDHFFRLALFCLVSHILYIGRYLSITGST